ncbi:MAG: hypothetical protein IJZ17_00140 [Muribaculaceae bacterium]|nr:hypothetical protein [Muribaculaceae bacterium]
MKQLKFDEKHGWRGLTLDELRYLRALNGVRIEIKQQQLVERCRESLDGLISQQSGKGLFYKMMSGLSWLDYALLAFRLGGRIAKTLRSFR